MDSDKINQKIKIFKNQTVLIKKIEKEAKEIEKLEKQLKRRNEKLAKLLEEYNSKEGGG